LCIVSLVCTYSPWGHNLQYALFLPISSHNELATRTLLVLYPFHYFAHQKTKIH
jgi:hypothetical protein